MWFFSRTLEIPWAGRVINEVILKKMAREKTLIEKSRKRQLNLLVYMLRKECEWMAKHFQTEKKTAKSNRKWEVVESHTKEEMPIR